MSSIFDGLAGVLSGTFGSTVTVTPVSGDPEDIQAVFRRNPVTLSGEDGRDVLDVLPILSVRRDLAGNIVTGALVDPGDGATYRVVNSLPSGSPADDAFINYELEKVT